MPAWFLTRLPWRQANVKFKTDFLTKLDLGHSKVPFQRGMPKIECLQNVMYIKIWIALCARLLFIFAKKHYM